MTDDHLLDFNATSASAILDDELFAPAQLFLEMVRANGSSLPTLAFGRNLRDVRRDDDNDIDDNDIELDGVLTSAC